MWEVGFMIVKGLEWCGESTRFLQTLLEFVFEVGWTIARRAESPDEVLLEITPALRRFGRCSFEPYPGESF
ncbi:hypothetical protein Tco_1522600 [Tanacetum coccineum]